ncbi:MAG: YkgJ family cysteine cluster protein [Desulfopila sp.]
MIATREMPFRIVVGSFTGFGYSRAGKKDHMCGIYFGVKSVSAKATTVIDLPKPVQYLCLAYKNLVHDIDGQMHTLMQKRFTDVLHCQPGCADCCIPFSVFPLEAAILADALQNLQLPQTEDVGHCIFLSTGLCQVYEARPIICRTQGLPLGYVDESSEAIEVSACPLNFSEEYPLGFADLLLMDRFNGRLARLNRRYCKETGFMERERIPLAMLSQ